MSLGDIIVITITSIAVIIQLAIIIKGKQYNKKHKLEIELLEAEMESLKKELEAENTNNFSVDNVASISETEKTLTSK